MTVTASRRQLRAAALARVMAASVSLYCMSSASISAQPGALRPMSGSPWPATSQPAAPSQPASPPAPSASHAPATGRQGPARAAAPPRAAPALQLAPLPDVAPLPPLRPADLGGHGGEEAAETPAPQVPSLSRTASESGAPAAGADGFTAVAPLPPVRPRFPIDTAPPEQPAHAAAAPAARKPSWWPFGKKEEPEPPAQESPDGLRTARRAVTDAEVDQCVARLRKAGAVVERIAPIANGSCGIRNGVRLTALPGGLPLSKPGTLSCAMAEATAEWLRGVAQPAARQYLKTEITGVIIGPTYACRTMNHQRRAKISEHGYANAIDIAGFHLDQRKPFTIMPAHATSGENLFQNFIRKNACRVFDTVIGPGGDRFHDDHLHFDLRNRRPGRQICR